MLVLMREQPWHIRKPNYEHYRWFTDLMDLHAMTTSWFRDLNIDQNSQNHQMKRVLAPEMKDNLQILSSLTKSSVPSDFEGYLDDAYPEEFLDRLEQTIWIVQAWSLRSILEKTPKSEIDALRNILEKSSWKSGRQCLQERWQELAKKGETDIRILVAVFRDSPFSGYPKHNPFLIRRAVTNELSVFLLNCPHQKPYLEVQSVADELCQLHHHWMHGFTYGVNTQIACEYHAKKKDDKNSLCSQRWYYLLDQ